MNIDSRRLRVFLCHSKEDKPRVCKLYQRLVSDGFDTWLDEEKLVPGQDWDLEIRKAVRKADAIIVCLSKGSVTKAGYVQKEIRFALDVTDEKPEGMIFLIPARFEDCDVPSRISRYQWIDLFTQDGYQRLRKSLQLRMKDLDIRFDANDVLAKSDEKKIRIPILGYLTASQPIPIPESGIDYVSENVYRSIDVELSLLPNRERNSKFFALEVKGDGMIDAMVNDGDIVIFVPVTSARNGEMVAAWLPRFNETTLKYFYREKDGYRLQPANPTMMSILVNKDEPLVIKGKVVMVIRQLQNKRSY